MFIYCKMGVTGPFLSHVTGQQTVTKVSIIVQFVDVHPPPCPYLSTFDMTPLLPLCVCLLWMTHYVYVVLLCCCCACADRVHAVDCLPHIWILDGRIITCE